MFYNENIGGNVAKWFKSEKQLSGLRGYNRFGSQLVQIPQGI